MLKHDEGLSALKEWLENRTTKNPPTLVTKTRMSDMQTLNNVTVNRRHFLHIKVCAMGTVTAPSYATIFMGNFEEKYM